MAKRTLIITESQLNEILGLNGSYLDGLGIKPDVGDNYANEITTDGSVDGGYPEPTTTDDRSRTMTNDWRGNAKLAGMGPITVHEEKEHGNARLANMQFGAKDGKAGKSYDATKMALSRKRDAEMRLHNGSDEEKAKAAKTLSRMRKNWSGLDAAEKQYAAAKANDKSVQGNRMGINADTDSQIVGDGIITSE